MPEIKKGKTPDFKGDGVAVWQNVDKNGKPYLSIDLFGGKNKGGFTLHAWLNEPRETTRKPYDNEPSYRNGAYPKKY